MPMGHGKSSLRGHSPPDIPRKIRRSDGWVYQYCLRCLGWQEGCSGAVKEKGSQKAVSSWWNFRAEAPPNYTGYYYAAIAVGLALGFQFVLIRKLKKGH